MWNSEDAAFVIHYDLLYNTLKMEQWIDRCHRIGQKNDVLSVAFINQKNFADVRKLELVSKRILVSDGVFGVSDDVIGGFSGDLDGAMRVISEQLRTRAQIENDHHTVLSARAEENKAAVAPAEDILFTTFTKELADKIHLTPQYVDERTAELNRSLRELVKWFFMRYNEEHSDCHYVIDEDAQCLALLSKPVLQFSHSEHTAPHWLKSSSRAHALDRLVPVEKLIAAQVEKLSPIHQEELARLKLQVAGKKAAISKDIDALDAQIKSLETARNGITNDRLRLLAMGKQINQLRREYMSKQENQFFDTMRLDLELEEQMKALSEKEKLTAKVVREFVIKLEATK